MSPAARAANIADELQHSDEALRAAEALLTLGLYRDACRAEFDAGRAFLDAVRAALPPPSGA